MKNIKKVFGLTITFLSIILIYQFVVVLLSDGHNITYEIAIDDKLFTINETYKKDNNEDGYYIRITDEKNKEFIFYVNNLYNKQKKIINDIKYYNKDNYLCLYPSDINNKTDFEILCNDGEALHSYHYANTKTDLSEFLKELKISNDYVDSTKETKVLKNVTYYPKNIYENEYVEIYRYKELYYYHNGSINNIKFSISDIYKNTLGAFVDDYFLAPIIRENRLAGYNIINVVSGEERKFEFNEKISTNCYVLGIANGNFYIFDLTNKYEIEISPKDSYTIIGSVDFGFKTYNKGKWEPTSVTEFTENKITFDLSHDENVDFEYDELYTSNNAYYYTIQNKVYKTYKNNLDIKILLFELDNYNNLKIENNRVYFIKSDCLYRYDQYGMKTLANNNEFIYNNDNIYHVYND